MLPCDVNVLDAGLEKKQAVWNEIDTRIVRPLAHWTHELMQDSNAMEREMDVLGRDHELVAEMANSMLWVIKDDSEPIDIGFRPPMCIL